MPPTSGHDRQQSSYPITSVDNALRLLELFQEVESVRLTDACSYLNVAHSTAHRLLAMLVQHGFVRQNSRTRAYEPGPTLVEIGLAVVQKMDLRTRARPVLETLSAKFRETVHLVVLEGNEVRYVDAVEGQRVLRVAPRTGSLLPAHCTSVGKVLLADLTQEELRQLYPESEPLATQTASSISTLAELTVILDKVRADGYATNEEESEEGVGSVAVALRDGQGTALGAIAVAAPVSRLNAEVQASIVAGLHHAAEEFANPTEGSRLTGHGRPA